MKRIQRRTGDYAWGYWYLEMQEKREKNETEMYR